MTSLSPSLRQPCRQLGADIVAHRTIGPKPLLARSLEAGKIVDRPVQGLAVDVAGKLEGTVMRFRREGDDDVIEFAVEIIKPLGLVGRQVDAGLFHHSNREPVLSSGLDT